MNFYCSVTEKDFVHKLGLNTVKTESGFFLSLDSGWSITNDHAFKSAQTSWCRINFKDKLSIQTNNLRDFPIYYNNTEISNFKKLENLLPADGELIWDMTMGNTITWKNNFYPEYLNLTLNFDQSHELLFESLSENVERFATANNNTVFVPVQNGIDTLTVRSLLDFFKIKYELFDLPKTDNFIKGLQKELGKSYWGFTQIKEIKNAVIATGFYGDEWILRNPYYVHALLSRKDIDIVNVFDKNRDCYMTNWFDQHYREKCERPVELTIAQLQQMLCNDYQIWPINDTSFFSPLKHNTLLKLLHADTETIIGQVTNATLSKSIIERCNPDLLGKLEHSKNASDPEYF